MRRLAPLVALLSVACAAPNVARVPEAMGGSVMDFDRGTGGFYSPSTSGVAGGPYTVGIASTNGATSDGEEHLTQAAPPPDARRDLVAGPITAPTTAAERVRRLQRALREKGYFQGAVNGVSDAALDGALRRFQADRGLPTTGIVDADTADALELKPAAAPAPPGAG